MIRKSILRAMSSLILFALALSYLFWIDTFFPSAITNNPASVGAGLFLILSGISVLWLEKKKSVSKNVADWFWILFIAVSILWLRLTPKIEEHGLLILAFYFVASICIWRLMRNLGKPKQPSDR